jgi:hypothetical protein
MTKIALASIYSFASIEMQATSEDIFQKFQAIPALLFQRTDLSQRRYYNSKYNVSK